MVIEVLHRGSADPQHVVEGMASVAAFRDSSELGSGGSSTLISLLNLWNRNIQSMTEDVDRNV